MRKNSKIVYFFISFQDNQTCFHYMAEFNEDLRQSVKEFLDIDHWDYARHHIFSSTENQALADASNFLENNQRLHIRLASSVHTFIVFYIIKKELLEGGAELSERQQQIFEIVREETKKIVNSLSPFKIFIDRFEELDKSLQVSHGL